MTNLNPSPKVVPRVIVDARFVGPTLHGFARYVVLLARGLRELGLNELPYTPVFLTGPLTDEVAHHFQGFETQVSSVLYLSPLESIRLNGDLWRGRADLYHSPTFSSLLGAPCPWISTVHDLCHLQYGGIKERLYYRLLLKPFAKRARALMTVSNFSQDQLAEWLNRPASSIEVVFNALDPALAKRPSETEIDKVLGGLGLQRGKYFFCLSNPKPHKNVAMLIEAYRLYRERGEREAWPVEVRDWPLAVSMSEFGAHNGVRALGSLPESNVRAVLAGAGALFFPSLYEGFGLPPAEAACLGVPVVVSDIAPHRESLAELRPDEALWLKPTDIPAWSAALEQVSRGHLDAPTPESGTRTLERYSVQKLASHMDRIYRSVLAVE